MSMMQSMDDQIISLQKQMMMNNLMFANHLKAMNQNMMHMSVGSLPQMLGQQNGGGGMYSHSMNDFDELDDIQNVAELSTNSAPKMNIGYDDDSSYMDLYSAQQQQQQQHKIASDDDEKVNENNMKMQPVTDCFDALLLGQTECVSMEANNQRARCTQSNEERWFNLFGSTMTENGHQYHWQIKLIQLDMDNPIYIGILDACYIDEYVKYNEQKKNVDGYFTKSKFGFGIDCDGNLKNDSKNGGVYCNALKQGDIVDVYFDMKQFVLWYGVNAKEYGVACKVHQSFYRPCIALFGSKHCVQITSCDTYSYK